MKTIQSFLIILALCSTEFTQSQAAPYPSSTVITDMNFDFSTHTREAEGSDNWPITWADDDHQYTSWGDGNGLLPDPNKALEFRALKEIMLLEHLSKMYGQEMVNHMALSQFLAIYICG